MQRYNFIEEKSKRKKKKAFTLAEVLICLGIIGIVAALVIPAFSVNTKKVELEKALLKNYSLVINSIAMAESEHGHCASWDYDFGTPAAITSAENIAALFDSNLNQYLRTATICAPNKGNLINNTECGPFFGWSNSYYYHSFILSDGSSYLVQSINPGMMIFVDVNGKRLPNKTGLDRHSFVISNAANQKTHKSCYSPYLATSTPAALQAAAANTAGVDCYRKTRFSIPGFNTYYSHVCTGLLWLNNFVFPDNYEMN